MAFVGGAVWRCLLCNLTFGFLNCVNSKKIRSAVDKDGLTIIGVKVQKLFANNSRACLHLSG